MGCVCGGLLDTQSSSCARGLNDTGTLSGHRHGAHRSLPHMACNVFSPLPGTGTHRRSRQTRVTGVNGTATFSCAVPLSLAVCTGETGVATCTAGMPGSTGAGTGSAPAVGLPVAAACAASWAGPSCAVCPLAGIVVATISTAAAGFASATSAGGASSSLPRAAEAPCGPDSMRRSRLLVGDRVASSWRRVRSWRCKREKMLRDVSLHFSASGTAAVGGGWR